MEREGDVPGVEREGRNGRIDGDLEEECSKGGVREKLHGDERD